MGPEDQKQNILPALIAVLVVFVFVLVGYSTVSEESRFKFKKDRDDAKENISYLPKESVLAVAHHFSGGLHTYAGAIETPTPCYKVASKIFSQKSIPEIIEISFNTKDSGDICAQVITPQEFMVSFSAGSDAKVSARLNGSPVDLSVTEVSSFDSLHSFRSY